MVSPRIFQVAAGVHSPPWEIMPGILDSAISNALSVALIVPDARRRRSLAAALGGPQFTIAREFGAWPSPGELLEIEQLNCCCSRGGSG